MTANAILYSILYDNFTSTLHSYRFEAKASEQASNSAFLQYRLHNNQYLTVYRAIICNVETISLLQKLYSRWKTRTLAKPETKDENTRKCITHA